MNSGRAIAAASLLSMCIISGIAFSGIATAEEAAVAAKTAQVDPTGTWKWEFNLNDNPAQFSLKLQWDGKQLTGKYTAFDHTTDIENAKFEDNKISFDSKREFNGNEFTVHFDGKTEPNDIVGKVGLDFGDGPREFDWHAERVIESPDILGKWKLKLETPQGEIEPELTITKQGDSLKGHYVSPFGERDAKELTFKDGELSWKISSDDNDQFDFEVVYRGKPEGNKIAGSTEFDFGGNTGKMDFTGERTPPEEKAASAVPAKESPAATPATPAAAAQPVAEESK